MDDQTIHDRRWWALAVLCLSLFVIVLDNTILNVALPALVRDLHASTSSLQWIVDGYTLVFAGLLLTAGSLGDRFGRKGALQIGLLLFCAGSILSAVSTSSGMLILTRASMGIGGALIMPSTLSLLTNIFTDPKERGRAIGVWAALAGAGSAVGPVLGGLLLRSFWWGSVFLINVPVTLAALAAGWFLLPTSRDPDAPQLDLFGALLSIVGLIAVLWAIIEAPTKGWGDSTVIGGFVIGVVVLGGFVTWELKSSHPMLDVRFFQNRRFSAANAAITMTFFAMFGSMFLITQYLQTVLGYSALQAGLRLLPMSLVMLFVAPSSPRIVERIGTKAVVGSGLGLVSIGLVLASRVPATNGYPLLLGSMVVLACGMGLVMAPATESIMGSLPLSKAGVGSAMNDTTRQFGGALGVAILGSVFATSYRPAVASKLATLGAPATVVTAAKDSVGGAVQAASAVGGSLGRAISDTAKLEFVHGFRGALEVGAVVTVIAAVIVWAFLPARASEVRPIEQTPLDGIASLTFAEAEGTLEADPATS